MPFIMAGLLNLYGDLGYGGWFDILIALAPLNSMLNPIVFLTLFHLAIVLAILLRITDSDYPFGILDLRILITHLVS
jgi:hypothetical protein